MKIKALYASILGLLAFALPSNLKAYSEPPVGLLNTMKAHAERYHVDLELAKKIVWCESAYNPLAKGPTKDHGFFQFVYRFWGKELAGKGWDIYVPEDNLEAGFWVLSEYGTWPWRHSQHCWGKLATKTYPQPLPQNSAIPRAWILPSGLVVIL